MLRHRHREAPAVTAPVLEPFSGLVVWRRLLASGRRGAYVRELQWRHYHHDYLPILQQDQL